MAEQIESIVGAGNMDAAKKDVVIAILRALDQPATTKRYLYARWARVVQIEASKGDLDSVATLAG
jgi:hypothetical protein